jgi:Na+-driven multidrug efflux pump
MRPISAEKQARQRRRLRRGLLIMGILLAMGIAVFIFSDQLQALFSPDKGPAPRAQPDQP